MLSVFVSISFFLIFLFTFKSFSFHFSSFSLIFLLFIFYFLLSFLISFLKCSFSSKFLFISPLFLFVLLFLCLSCSFFFLHFIILIPCLAYPIFIRFLISEYLTKQRNIKSWNQQNYLVIRGFCYIRPLV